VSEERRVPDACFDTLVDVIAAPALVALGAYAPPGQAPKVDLVHAKLTIELLRILRERSDGRRNEAESKRLDEMIDGLQRTYVAVVKKSRAEGK